MTVPQPLDKVGELAGRVQAAGFSGLLMRELFYPAVTRAKKRVRVVGSEAALRAAVERRAVRASGLAHGCAGEAELVGWLPFLLRGDYVAVAL